MRPGAEMRVLAGCFWICTALWAAAASAQQAPNPTEPKPGEGTQLQTGTSSGLTAETRLQGLLADHQYARLATELEKLPPEEANLYRGVLANRSNDLKTSIELLEPLVDSVSASGDVSKEKLLRQSLAEDYLRSGAFAKAAVAYIALNARLGTKLTPDEQDAIEMPLKLLPLIKDNPPPTVDPSDPFSVQYEYNPIGLLNVPVFVDALPRSWLFDPTAPFNLIDRATANEVGLKVSPDSATIRTLTGKPIKVYPAIIPRFTIGGRLTLHDMTVFVFDDADYSFPRVRYQVEGVLGYPALSALGSVRITDHATIEVQPARELDAAAKEDRIRSGAPFYLDGDQVIVGLGRGEGSAEADDRMFAVDAGGQASYLTSRYFDEHAAEFNQQKVTEFSVPGEPSQPSYVAETVPLRVGKTALDLHYMAVLTQPMGSAALDDVYGVLGQDALGQLRSYTFDYRTMRFSVEPEP